MRFPQDKNHNFHVICKVPMNMDRFQLLIIVLFEIAERVYGKKMMIIEIK